MQDFMAERAMLGLAQRENDHLSKNSSHNNAIPCKENTSKKKLLKMHKNENSFNIQYAVNFFH